jgi:hypothetical protein
MQTEYPKQVFGNPGAKPWNLSRTPLYDEALAIDVIAADQISEAEFRKQYVNRNRPCLLKGAVAHWPACQDWQRTDYLKEKTSDVKLDADSHPMSEFVPIFKEPLREKMKSRNEANTQKISFHEFLAKVKNESVYRVIATLGLAPGQPLGELCGDFRDFSFLPNMGVPRYYPPYRAFFYRQSYTDWHLHPSDETLMAQIVGKKEVLLYPPDEDTWNILWPALHKKGYLYDIDPRKSPQFLKIKPYKAVVESGDALYIPVFWWHAVESSEDLFEATVATTFNTPGHLFSDLSYPAAREMLARTLTSRLLFSRFGRLQLKIFWHFLMRTLFLDKVKN